MHSDILCAPMVHFYDPESAPKPLPDDKDSYLGAGGFIEALRAVDETDGSLTHDQITQIAKYERHMQLAVFQSQQGVSLN